MKTGAPQAVLKVLFLLTVTLAITGCQRGENSLAPQRQIGTVDLVVDFGGDQPKIEVSIPCSVDSTAFTTLQRADQNGDLKLVASGNGETAFVKSIDGIASDTQSQKYWLFFVNDTLGQQGAGTVQVNPGDQVRWSYQGAPVELTQ